MELWNPSFYGHGWMEQGATQEDYKRDETCCRRRINCHEAEANVCDKRRKIDHDKANFGPLLYMSHFISLFKCSLLLLLSNGEFNLQNLHRRSREIFRT
jgi:hypothetical protein